MYTELYLLYKVFLPFKHTLWLNDEMIRETEESDIGMHVQKN